MGYLHFLLIFGLLYQHTTALPQPQGDAGDINYEQDAEAENAGNSIPPPLSPTAPAPPTPPGTTIAASPPPGAAPSGAVTSSTSSSTSASPSGYGDNIETKDNSCAFLDPPNEQATLYMCRNICGDAIARQVAAGNTSSVSCIAFTPLGQSPTITELGYHNEQVTVGNCSCNNPLIDMLADTYINAVPDLIEIGCPIFFNMLLDVVAIGALAIPGAGEAIDAGMIAGITAAKLAEYAYDAGEAGLNAFANYANPCGNSQTSGNMPQIFGVLRGASPARIPGGLKIPPKLPKGNGDLPKAPPPPPPKEPAPAFPKSRGPPPPKEPTPALPKSREPAPSKEPSPAPSKQPSPAPSKQPSPAPSKEPTTRKPTSKPSPTSKESEKSSPAPTTSDPACSKEKRANGKDAACGKKKHVTSITIPNQKSKAIPKTKRITCSAAMYGQACFNYYSVMKNGRGDEADRLFTCSDSHTTYRARDLTATRLWKDTHNAGTSWKNYITNQYVFVGAATRTAAVSASCNADEWPPAYFRSEKQLGQLMRWLPGSENKGAGQLWKSWCENNDGGRGNGQLKDGKLNMELVKTVGNPLGSSTKKNGETTTTFESYSAEFTRGVFSMDFDWTGGPLNGQTPDDSNDWGLKLNPCWPQPIAPDDPGFVLQIDDPWYTRNKPKPDLRNDYSSKQIPANLVRSANNWLNAHPNYQTNGAGAGKPAPKRPGDSSNSNGPNKAQKGNIPGSSKRSLDIIDDELVIRESNMTRKLTDEEIKGNFEIIQCEDHTCSKERRSYDEEDGVLVIPGANPSMSPPTEVEAVPTEATQVASATGIKAFERRSASPELPAETAAPLI